MPRKRSTPSFVARMAHARRLLAGTLARVNKPAKLPVSLQRQILGLAGYWFTMRAKGHVVIFPGTEKMMVWGQCEERTARTNTGKMKAWKALIPTAHEKGGAGKATEFVFCVENLWRALVTMGANPHPSLLEALQACDEPRHIPAKSIGKTKPFQSVSLPIITAKKGATVGGKKGAKKGATVAPRSFEYDTGSLSAAVEGVCPHGETNCPSASQAEPAQGAGEDAAPAEPARKASDGPSSDLLKKNTHSEPTGERASQLAGAASLPGQTLCGTGSDMTRDAATLLAHIEAHGPTTYGAAAAALGWGATRAWQAQAELLAAGAVRHIAFGRTELATAPRGVVLPFALGARANATTPRNQVQSHRIIKGET